jgi:hypothetical protein
MSAPLPAAAQAAWDAYLAMAQTKHQHFGYLQHLEEKYQPYGQASTAEQNQLQELLQAHDAQVALFRSTLAQLRIDDSAAYGELIKQLAADASK